MKRFLLIFLCALLFFSTAFADLEVHFLDVGQGDAAIILCDDMSMIIDGGRSSYSQFLYSYITNTLKLTHMDYMIATHPDADHIGGLAAALNAVPVDLLLTPVTSHDSKGFENMMKYAEKQGTAVLVPEEGDYLVLGGARIEILHCYPEATYTNDKSIVVRIDYGETSFLFTGDAERTSEFMMVDAGVDLKADVLKVGHHGSATSTEREFLEKVQPKYAVISCGKDNKYGHPRPEVLKRLSDVGAEIYRTDELGTIVCYSDGKNLRFEN